MPVSNLQQQRSGRREAAGRLAAAVPGRVRRALRARHAAAGPPRPHSLATHFQGESATGIHSESSNVDPGWTLDWCNAAAAIILEVTLIGL